MKKIALVLMLVLIAVSYTLVAQAAVVIDEFIGCNCHQTLYTTRLAGEDRIETAIECSKRAFSLGFEFIAKTESLNTAGMVAMNRLVVICRSDDYPDALAAAGLAGWHHAPILLNPPDELDERVKDEIDRLFGDIEEGDRAIIIGGTGALSEDVEDELEDMGLDVERFGGDDRYETAALIADELDDLDGHIDNVMVVTGENWPDGLAASAWAYYTASWYYAPPPVDGMIGLDDPWPVLLVEKNDIPGATLDWLLSHKDVNAYVLGGSGAVGSGVMEDLGYYLNGDIERVAGEDRYETCIEIAEHPDMWDINRDDGPNRNHFIFATGSNFPDALASSQLLGCFKVANWNTFPSQAVGAPIILTSSLDDSVEDYFDELFDGATPHDPEVFANVGTAGHGLVVGGFGVVSKDTEDDIAEALSDGDFEPTDSEPNINSFDVTINPDNDIPDVAQYDFNDEVLFTVETDKRIVNNDLTYGKVVIEDISELGGKQAPYNEDDFVLEPVTLPLDPDGDNVFESSVLVKKKSTDPDQREVTFVARAENQAGEDTMESDSIEIYN